MKERPGQSGGRSLTDAEIYKKVTDYSGGYKPKQTKTARVVEQSFHEVFTNKPRTVDTSKSAAGQRKQMIAIALSKARAAGARVRRAPRGK